MSESDEPRPWEPSRRSGFSRDRGSRRRSGFSRDRGSRRRSGFAVQDVRVSRRTGCPRATSREPKSALKGLVQALPQKGLSATRDKRFHVVSCQRSFGPRLFSKKTNRFVGNELLQAHDESQ